MPGTICIMSLSPIADDPRVRRQCEAFDNAGWKVTALGLPGATSPTPHWTIHELEPPSSTATTEPQNLRPTTTSARGYRLPKYFPKHPFLMQLFRYLASTFHLREMLASTHSGRHALYARYPAMRPVMKSGVALVSFVLRAVLVLDMILYMILAPFVWLGYWVVSSIINLMLDAIDDVRALVRHIRSGNYSHDDIGRFVKKIPANLKERLRLIAHENTASLRKFVLMHARQGPWIWLIQAALLRISWRFAVKLYMMHPIIRSFYLKGREIKADIYLANDWHMLPVAISLAAYHHAKFAYDTHEYALEEYRYRWTWRLTKRPMIYQLEKQAMQHACVVSAVSPGIAQGLKKDYAARRPVHAIRNVPPRHAALPFHPTGERINVLFHGIIAPDRGLEACVRSVQYWRPEFHFQLRGPFSNAEFESTLRSLVKEYGVGDRVHFLPKVPMTEMVRHANLSDVGISTPPKTSKHNIFALPNKLFEYVQAGLALAVCDLPDMAPIVTANDCGVLIDEVTPEHIAQAINSLTRERIDYYKHQSQKAAESLNWETEQTIMLALYERALVEGSV